MTRCYFEVLHLLAFCGEFSIYSAECSELLMTISKARKNVRQKAQPYKKVLDQTRFKSTCGGSYRNPDVMTAPADGAIYGAENARHNGEAL